jgi:hypothetical protein
MQGQASFFDIDEHLKDLSAKVDDLERLNKMIDFEMFRAALGQAVPRADRGKGGRPPFNQVSTFKVLILQTMHSLGDERCKYLIKDRLSFIPPSAPLLFVDALLRDSCLPNGNGCWLQITIDKKINRRPCPGRDRCCNDGVHSVSHHQGARSLTVAYFADYPSRV